MTNGITETRSRLHSVTDVSPETPDTTHGSAPRSPQMIIDDVNRRRIEQGQRPINTAPRLDPDGLNLWQRDDGAWAIAAHDATDTGPYLRGPHSPTSIETLDGPAVFDSYRLACEYLWEITCSAAAEPRTRHALENPDPASSAELEERYVAVVRVHHEPGDADLTVAFQVLLAECYQLTAVLLKHLAAPAVTGRETKWANWMLRINADNWQAVLNSLRQGSARSVLAAVRGVMSISRPLSDTAPRDPRWQERRTNVEDVLDTLVLRRQRVAELFESCPDAGSELTPSLRRLGDRYGATSGHLSEPNA